MKKISKHIRISILKNDMLRIENESVSREWFTFKSKKSNLIYKIDYLLTKCCNTKFKH